MDTFSNFGEQYKSFSNTNLLEVLENVEDYQPAAIAAAQKEFKNRQLTPEQIEEAMQPVLAKKIEANRKREKVKAIEDKFKNARNTIVDTIRPLENEAPTTERLIRVIALLYAGIFVYHIIANYKTVIAVILDIPELPSYSIHYLGTLLLLPVGAVNFWRKKTIGWILLSIFIISSLLGITALVIQSLNWKPSGLEGLDNLFPRTSPLTYGVQLFFLISSLVVFLKGDMREVFKINKEKILMVIAIGGLLFFIQFFIL